MLKESDSRIWAGMSFLEKEVDALLTARILWSSNETKSNAQSLKGGKKTPKDLS